MNCLTAATRSQRSQASNNQPRKPVQARVYSFTLNNIEVEENATDVVTSTIPLFSRLACILFDLGARHSFISSTYVKLCSLSIEPLEQNMSMATLVGDAVTCRKCVENCPIIIEGKTLPEKLVVFSMLGFYVIQEIDCHEKEVIF